jgi:para-nitrobenzyl esterase
MSAGGGVIAPSKTLAYNIAETLLGIIPPGTPLASTPSPTKTDAQIAALLRGASADAIEETLMVNGSISLGVVSPYSDGTVITGPYADLISAGKYSKLPIVIGGTEYESKPFLVLLVPQWSNAITFLFAPSSTTFENIWTPALSSGLFQLCGEYDSLEWKAVGVDQLATSMASQQPGNVYASQFRWGGVSDPGNGSDLAVDAAFLYGAGHATDIPFYFGWDVDVYNLGSYNPSLSLFNSSNYGGRIALQQTMMSYLGNFAATGNPNSRGLPTWKPWSDVSGQPTYNILDATANSTNISMATGSYTKAGVEAAVATLPIPAPAIGLIEEFFFF